MKQNLVYIFRWDNNDYFYIGQTIDFRQRMHTHKNRVKDSKRKLYHVWRKYGEPTKIEFIECSSIDELNLKEQELLTCHFNNINCLNLAPEVGCPRGFKHSEKFKKEKSLAMKKYWEEGKLGQNCIRKKELIVIKKEFGTLFNSITEASETLNLSKSCISDCLVGRDRHYKHKGYEFF